ncbi:MAG: hypothetical protein HY852_03525 [Bradyrhizobium sp.]|uniref:hypothetical protein n=1 Tax=Bradyrhizobium sp. TaxID=376 RepID=UPI0025C5D9E6|nr:hypothetical protein [Bradyrhizobium sp.]MBI5260873.1 hypothetical protein [Bradyrhizobium sp.]
MSDNARDFLKQMLRDRSQVQVSAMNDAEFFAYIEALVELLEVAQVEFERRRKIAEMGTAEPAGSA